MKTGFLKLCDCLLPYYIESTGSHLNTKVRQYLARLVLGWEIVWEHLV